LRKVLPIFRRALFYEVLKLPPLKNTGIFCEEAEQQSNQVAAL
jgi:hypothetical protein